MTRRLLLSTFLALAVWSLIPGEAASGRPRRPPFVPSYTVAEVGRRPGGEAVQVLGLDADGHVSGCWQGSFFRGVFWGGAPNTVELEVPFAWTYLGPTAVNSSGLVTGYLEFESSDAPDLKHVFVRKDGVLTDLGTLGGYDAVPTALNEAGQVVGSSDLSRRDGSRGFLWEGAGLMSLGVLGQPPNSLGYSTARDINAAGQIVGSSSTQFSDYSHPVTWIGRQIADLGVPKEVWYASAVAINDHGTIVVSGRTSGTHQRSIPYLWREGAYTMLPGLTPTGSSGVWDLNDFDWAVGTFSDATSGGGTTNPRAVLWRGGTITDLNALVPQDLGVRLRTAVAINNRGQILCVGDGEEDEPDRAFVLTPRPDQEFSGSWKTLKVKQAGRKWKFTGAFLVENAGTQTLAASRVRFVLSGDLVAGPDDVTLKEVAVKALPAASSQQLKLTAAVTLPQPPAGSYVLAVLDSGAAVTEADETNNGVAFGPVP